MRNSFTLFLALATLALPATAQQQDTFLINGPYSMYTTSTLYEIDHNAKLIRTVTTLPTGVRPMDIVMSEDNRTYRALGYDLARSVIMVFDVTRSGATQVLTTFQTSMPQGMLRTDDGDWLVSTQVMAQRPLSRIFRIRGNTVSTLTSAWNLLGYAIAWDLDTGDLAMRGRGPDTFGSTLWGYYRVDLNTGQFTTIAAYPEKGLWPATIGAHHPPYEAVPGQFIDAIYDGAGYAMRMVRVHPERGVVDLSGNLGGHAPSDLVAAGQRNLPAKYVMLIHTHPIALNYYLFWMSGDGRPLAVKPLSLPVTLISDTRLMRVQDRHLCWFMDQAPNGRSLRLDFPGEAGRPYVVVFGMSGPRPGVRLPDGRAIPINPDALTVASLGGGLGSLLSGTVGTLDPVGRARVTVDTNALGSRLKGLRVWAAALLLDGKSPSGVSHILGPTVLNIKS